MSDKDPQPPESETLDAAYRALRAFAPELESLTTAKFAQIIARALPDHLEPFNALLQQCYQAQLHSLSNAVASAPASGQGTDDRGFADSAWTELPFYRWIKSQYDVWSAFWTKLPDALELQGDDRKQVVFALRQWQEAAAPTNYLPLNPAAIRKAFATEGASLARGAQQFAHDVAKGRVSMSDEGAFTVGKDLATTPGDVIFENELVQLIQYRPTTAQVHSRPLLIIPPFINKFYVLDLRPQNSFVKYAIAQGHQVFLVSWRNVDAAQQHASWEDYVGEGVLVSIDVALNVAASESLNLLGFCVGGTLSACAAAIDGARKTPRIHSLTLLATLLDFSDTGDISVYIDQDYVRQCEARYAEGGIVKGAQLASAFASLRPRDLLWHFFEHNYLLGATPPPFDLLYWNDDSANVPGPLFAYYLRNMYLDNRLRDADALQMCDAKINLRRIRVASYVLAAKDDHIVPWRSAWIGTKLVAGKSRFVLTESGHIAGVINPPGAKRRGYWLNDSVARTSEAWFDAAQYSPGSWWDDWTQWLGPLGGPMRNAPARSGNHKFSVIEAAPGRYVRKSPP